ncbi:hypothetical protein BDV93DRAFT_529811 [Ceratobasidium sp. AG-I]|nr:hypothetical protein BDV93DRAFT_529811 [Ceratobasidium sp. AG-I]
MVGGTRVEGAEFADCRVLEDEAVNAGPLARPVASFLRGALPPMIYRSGGRLRSTRSRSDFISTKLDLGPWTLQSRQRRRFLAIPHL